MRKPKRTWSEVEWRLRGVFLLDISSTGSCTRSNLELARICKTTTLAVQQIISLLVSEQEIVMGSVEGFRTLKYPKSKVLLP
jgi:hypothetical protein